MTNLAYNLSATVINLFADTNMNKTTSTGMSNEMKTYYDMELIRLADPELVHDQFGQKKPIPKGKGKTIEFRKFDSLPVSLTALTEGVTPSGQALTVTAIEATVSQYGQYVTLTDMLDMTAIDPVQVEAVEMIASQAGRTLDQVTREVINAGTNVMYSGGKATRATLTDEDFLTVDDIKRAVRFLKTQNARKINGDFVAIIHPDVAYDLTNDPAWEEPHKYVDTQNIYNGELGRLYGVRFIENTEAKTFTGASGLTVYSTLVIGLNAYGVTEITGGGLEYIMKQLGEGEDPLNQRSTVGWKATKTAEILIQQYMIRIESASTFSE